MKVQDVMTTDVVTIGPDVSVRDAANMLVEHEISGLPVCDEEQRVIGVVSEVDILVKEHDPIGRRSRPLAWIVAGESTRDLARSRARTVRDAMSVPAITIGPYHSVATAALLMRESRVNRLPVVQDGMLVGIVTRSDLLRAFTYSLEELELEIRGRSVGVGLE